MPPFCVKPLSSVSARVHVLLNKKYVVRVRRLFIDSRIILLNEMLSVSI